MSEALGSFPYLEPDEAVLLHAVANPFELPEDASVPAVADTANGHMTSINESGAERSDGELYESLGSVALSTDTVRSYLNQIGKIPLLTAEQEVELSRQIEAGQIAARVLGCLQGEATPEEGENGYERFRPDMDLLPEVVAQGEEAKHHMVQANLRLVVSIAKRYTGRGMELLDIIQEGNTGLIRAVEKFDYAKGYKFSTYAGWWIRQGIQRALDNQARTIRVPNHMAQSINRARLTANRLRNTLGREPTDEEIAADLGETDPRMVIWYRELDREPASLTADLGEDSDATLADFLVEDGAPAPDSSLTYQDMGTQVNKLLETLGERESAILRMRFGLLGEPIHTIKQVSAALGLSRERVAFLESRALSRLSKAVKAAGYSLQDLLPD